MKPITVILRLMSLGLIAGLVIATMAGSFCGIALLGINLSGDSVGDFFSVIAFVIVACIVTLWLLFKLFSRPKPEQSMNAPGKSDNQDQGDTRPQ